MTRVPRVAPDGRTIDPEDLRRWALERLNVDGRIREKPYGIDPKMAARQVLLLLEQLADARAELAEQKKQNAILEGRIRLQILKDSP